MFKSRLKFKNKAKKTKKQEQQTNKKPHQSKEKISCHFMQLKNHGYVHLVSKPHPTGAEAMVCLSVRKPASKITQVTR